MLCLACVRFFAFSSIILEVLFKSFSYQAKLLIGLTRIPTRLCCILFSIAVSDLLSEEMHPVETNPHFRRPLQPDRRAQHPQPQPQDHPHQPQPLDQHSDPTTPWASRPSSSAPRLKKHRHDPYSQPPTQSPPQPQPPLQDNPDQPQPQRQLVRAPRLKKHRQDPYAQPPTPQRSKSKSQDQHVQQPRPRVQIQDPHSQPSDSQDQPHPHRQDHHHPQHHDRRSQQNIQLLPLPRQTNPLMWFGAIFCAIFWVLVIVGGLAVLIVYLIFRPRSPRFDVATATLNAAYLDMGYLLNADMNLLANFTNPNKKVRVDFSYMIINLYYGNSLVATQFIEPFSASKEESMLVNLHMVSSQVRLPILESQRLQKQMETNGIKLDLKGFFRARSNFGTLLRYSYWLHSYCSLIVAGPPDGVLLRSKCITKH